MAYTFKHGDQPVDGITIQRAVGRGGFGEVYYALTESGKQVALKYLRENPEIELRGIAHVMNLKSPHLLTIYDVKRNTEGESFVVMEYVGGPSLREIMMAEPHGMAPAKAAFFFSGIAKGLAYLHERGIVHRDLKPANIFYDDGYVKIGDYGLSKHMSVSNHSGQTVSVGTVHYMAPEIGSGSYTRAIDVYALGVILFEMLTGRLPFSGASMGEILMRHLSDRPDLSGIPEPFAPVISKALAKDPNDRYQDVSEMMAAVVESDALSAELRSFDPTSLSMVPRQIGPADPERTLTRSPGLPPIPPVPPLDVREAGRFEALSNRLEGRLRQRVAKLDQRIRSKVGKLGGPVVPEHPISASARADKAAGLPAGKSRLAHGMLLFGATVAASILTAFVFGPGGGESVVAAVAIAMSMIGGTLGILATYFVCLRRLTLQTGLLERLAFLGIGGMAMAPALGPASGVGASEFFAALFGAMASLAICDWSRRVESGRRGLVKGGDAFGAAIPAFVASLMFGAEETAFLGAAIAAGLSLLTSGAAAMWPVKLDPVLEPMARGDWRHRFRIGTVGVRVGDQPYGAMAGGVPATGAAVAAANAAEALRGGAFANAKGAAPAAAPRQTVVQREGPGAIGRVFNGTLAFLGIMLILGGLIPAIGYSRIETGLTDGTFSINVGTDAGLERQVRAGRVVTPPKPALLVPILIGGLLVVLSRRHYGGLHFLRAFVGSALCVVSAALAMGPAAQGWESLLATPDWNQVGIEAFSRPVLINGGMVVVAACLLLWPRSRSGRVVVI